MIVRTSASISRRKRARSGFTLVESMITVLIVGLMAVTVMPTMIEMMANTRQHSLATDAVLLARKARQAAVLGGKYAYALMFQQTAGGGDGAMQIVTGVTAHCNRGTGIPINSIYDIITPPVGWQTTLGSLTMREMSFGSHRMYATMELPQGTVHNALRICYQPNGETHVYSGGLPGGGGEQAQPAVLYIRRQYAGRIAGVAREVVFMPGGTARLR